jgi:Cu2+-exporting ATPase
LAASETSRFCCAGCEAAFALIAGLHLGSFYQRRIQEIGARALRPDPTDPRYGMDFARGVTRSPDGICAIELAIDGLTCGACVWLIERVLQAEPNVISARVNLTTRRLKIRFRGVPDKANFLARRILALGYRLAPYDPAASQLAEDKEGKRLIRAMAVAGFAAANVMLLSLGTWFGATQYMGPATRDLLHWVSALIALPAVAYAGQPFFASAAAALRHGRANMDVPISLGVLIACAMSLYEITQGGQHAYFDSAVTLLFFLLIGRVLDHHARGAARQMAAQLLMLRVSDAQLITADGTQKTVAASSIVPGDRIYVPLGARFAADGTIEDGSTEIDASLVSGEALPKKLQPGAHVFAGSLNLANPVTLRATATADNTLLAECQRLIDAAEQARGRFVTLSERIARAYAPAVHLTALTTFLVWHFGLGRDVLWSLRTAIAVLIITCPCALALAVPAVQVIATSRLLRRGVLLKSPTALERLAEIDHIVFDKTGTLTEPLLVLSAENRIAENILRLAASLACVSNHPLCRALSVAAGPVHAQKHITEFPGTGLAAQTEAGELRLGSAAFCGATAASTGQPELWLRAADATLTRFVFEEKLRAEAAATIKNLQADGYAITLLSGDRAASVMRIAAELGIGQAQAGMTPPEKLANLNSLRLAGHHVLMFGDGLNDGPALAAAYVACAPASGADLTQTVADVVIEGSSLAPLRLLLAASRRARRAVIQNLSLALLYNCTMVPLAISGHVTPWLAAIAMSASSLAVIGNAFRAGVESGGK